MVLQPGGHLEPADATLAGAAERELAEETGIDPGAVSCVSQAPVYVEFGRVPARAEKGEPDHFHLDFGYAFATADGDVGPHPGVRGDRCRLVPARRGRAPCRAPHRPGSDRAAAPPGRGALAASALRRITGSPARSTAA
ncbi:MAG TPA: NUDIX domain-containing protein [Trebonia sp.]|nr:NUDIX domain-containing protein [Trebonia sp.]